MLQSKKGSRLARTDSVVSKIRRELREYSLSNDGASDKRAADLDQE